MFSTATTKVRWLYMMNVKSCSRIVNDMQCPCADKLRRSILRIPLNKHQERVFDAAIEKQYYEYISCRDDTKHES